MNVSIGINPITWSNDDLQYVGANNSLEKCLREAAAAGYAGLELGHKFPRDPAVLKPLLEEHGLSLVSGWYSGELLRRSAAEEIDAIGKHADLLCAMGCKVLIFAEVTGCIHSNKDIRLSRRPNLHATQWQSFGERMSAVAAYCADRGLALCYHHHMGTVVQSRADIDALMNSSSDEVRLLVDTGHAYFAGADPVQLVDDYTGRIGHVHCKDVRDPVMRQCQNRDSSFLDAVLDGVFTVPGDGDVEYERFFTALRKAAYEGWIVVEAEQDPAVAPPDYYASLGYRNLARLSAA